MERVVSRVLFVFAAGFGFIGLTVGVLEVNTDVYCGSVLWHDEGCSQPTSMIALVIVLLGLAVTCFIAALIAREPAAAEEPPVVYPGGAQV